MEEQISRFRNNCTLVAIKEVTRKPDAEIIQAARKNGYVNDKGMRNSQWINAARQLGLELKEVAIKPDGAHGRLVQYERYNSYYDQHMTCQRWLSPNFTLGEFIKEYPKGTFLISVMGHALVVRDGKVVDHNRWGNFGFRRRMVSAHLVLNPPELKIEFTPYLMIPRKAVKRRGTAAYMRFIEAIEYLNSQPNVTIEMLTKNTKYTYADFKHDFAKGIVAYVPQNQ